MNTYIEEIEKYVAVKEGENDNILLCIELLHENNRVSVEPVKKSVSLSQSDFSLLKEKVLDKIMKLPFKKNICDKNDHKKLHVTLNVASNFIAMDGRIGSANNMICSQETYDSYKDIFDKFDYTYFIADIADIILYRKNNFTQPGVAVVYNNNNYEVIENGLYPENQFRKIEII